MSFHRSCLFLFLVLPWILVACPKPLLDDVAQLEKSLIGSFSSEMQAKSDSNFFDIRLEVVPIWIERDDGPWLYVEQAAAENLDNPYRQRVYHLSKGDSFLVSEIYSFKDPLRFAGDWQKANPLSELQPDSLLIREGCAVYLTRVGKEDFDGQTKQGSCSSSLRGASYATSEVEIDSSSLRSWDRGFDLSQKQVWGSEFGAYIFERIPEAH